MQSKLITSLAGAIIIARGMSVESNKFTTLEYGDKHAHYTTIKSSQYEK